MNETIVLGVIGEDCHSVGLKIIDYVFSEAGFNVVNIGTYNKIEDFTKAAKENRAEAILVSTLNGHGEIECEGIRKACEEFGLDDILLYVGGNLVIGKQHPTIVENRYKNMGIDRIYFSYTPLEQAVQDLRHDIRIKRQKYSYGM
ncbi:methylaspartate mutase subunit S [Bacillus cereus group sp. TH152-1LC]|uniref:methylaspartate mutase subunit S n=1 Tax=Bacillus cereus group sp. TH152-1LC TaxID=3018060 RepID=UPI0022E52A1C|nr:methylaspartate mutase subunit S [Bacillus cereus group sp. TH152-1LC]MDA1677505.1 methylaspartate mutase subunit S [Bacillus cereus group sp. TH152-1LC]